MCCLLVVIALIGPRAGIILWWLFDMSRWASAFHSFIWPLLGFIFLPWTTLAYILVFPQGINGLDLLALILGIIIDLGSYGGGYKKRRK